MPVKTRCPNPSCAQVNAVDAFQVKSRVRCPNCGTRYVAESTVISDGPAGDGSKPPATAPPGIGRFVIRKKLGAGAFGTVYRAYDPHLDREVALKLPHPAVLESPKKGERFLREAKAAARLRHPHIVPVFDAGTDNGRPYIATAFINGRPLSEAIEEGGMEYDRAARIARELAEALAYAHEQGIVHRDVKPHNIMLDEQDHAHLMDFGLAARADEAAKLTNDGAILGTPAYMSPEQAAGQQGDATPAMDQYAAGVVLYEMLTGRVPFDGLPAAIMYKVLNEEPPPITLVRKRISKDLETICRTAMSRRAEDRYAGCQAMADDLRRWGDGESISARRLTPVERLRRFARREPRIAGGILAFTCALLITGIGGLVLAANLAREKRRVSEEAARADELLVLARRNEADARASEARANTEAERANTAVRVAQAEREKAEAQMRLARTSEQAAVRAQREAEEHRRAAEAQKGRAEAALAQARRSDEKAREASERTFRDELPRRLAEVEAHLAAGRDEQARALLSDFPADRRGVEWAFLNRWSQSKGQAFVDFRLPVPLPQGTAFAYAANDRQLLLVVMGRAKDLRYFILSLENGRVEQQGPLTTTATGSERFNCELAPDGEHFAVAVSPVARGTAGFGIFRENVSLTVYTAKGKPAFSATGLGSLAGVAFSRSASTCFYLIEPLRGARATLYGHDLGTGKKRSVEVPRFNSNWGADGRSALCTLPTDEVAVGVTGQGRDNETRYQVRYFSNDLKETAGVKSYAASPSSGTGAGLVSKHGLFAEIDVNPGFPNAGCRLIWADHRDGEVSTLAERLAADPYRFTPLTTSADGSRFAYAGPSVAVWDKGLGQTTFRLTARVENPLSTWAAGSRARIIDFGTEKVRVWTFGLFE